MNKGRLPSVGSPMWICWTNNHTGSTDCGGYVMHAATDTGSRTLCGCRMQEFGDRITPYNQPGCKRCKRALANIACETGPQQST